MIVTHRKVVVSEEGRAREPRGATHIVFAFLLIEISSRKAVPEVTSTFPGPLHQALLLWKN